MNVQLKHFRAVNIDRIGIGRFRSKRNVAGARSKSSGQVVGRRDFVLEADLDDVFCDGDAADGSACWIDTGDTGDYEIGVCEVEVARVD